LNNCFEEEENSAQIIVSAIVDILHLELFESTKSIILGVSHPLVTQAFVWGAMQVGAGGLVWKT